MTGCKFNSAIYDRINRIAADFELSDLFFAMKLIAVTASGFFGFEQNTRFDFVDNRIICVGANGTGKSNILNLVEFFLIHGTGLNIKLHWTQGRSAWEVHKQCAASLHFSLTTAEQEGFAKWRLVSILGLMSTEPNIRTIVANLERQDMEDLSQAFTVAEITPQDANDVAGVEKSPLFRKLIGERSSTKRVKLFWEILEKALLGVYARKKPYDTAVYCASTEPRDLSSVVFQQVLCDNLDREQLVQQLEGSAVSSDIRVLVPCVLTLEDEVQALRAALCPASGQIHSMQHRGLAFCTVASGELWASIEQHLRYGMQKMSHPVISGAEVERDVVDLNLATCAFATPPTLRGYPRVESLVDVRTYISRLVLETEKYMKTRPAGCQMEHIGGITYALRRLLLRSVCILPQDRTFVGDGTYLCLTTHDVEGFVTRLMESSNRDDIRAVSRMQTAMRTMTGQEIRSHRYFESGACVVGMSTAFRHSAGVAEAGLRNVGGGYKELLVVLMAMHGVGADSVLLDSPGFSLHPPQQKALALWISKCLFENTHSQVQHSPVSIVLITNSTEFITEDSLSCLYCFQRVLQSSVKSYTYNTANLQVFAPAVGGLDQIGVPVFDKPVESAIITYVIPPGTEIRCRGTRNAFSELVDGSGFIRLSDVMLICEDSPENEIAIR